MFNTYRHDGGETSGDSSCFGANTEWWTDKGMFAAGPGLKVGDGDGEDKVGFVFAENECDTSQNDKPAGCDNSQNSQNPCRTANCFVEPAYVASYAPYGRASVTGSWQYTSNTAAPTTWATTTRVFELDVSQFQLDAGGSSSGGGGGDGGGGGNNNNGGGGGGGGNNNNGGGGGGQCTQMPAGCTQAPCPAGCVAGSCVCGPAPDPACCMASG